MTIKGRQEPLRVFELGYDDGFKDTPPATPRATGR